MRLSDHQAAIVMQTLSDTMADANQSKYGISLGQRAALLNQLTNQQEIKKTVYYKSAAMGKSLCFPLAYD